ncbi:MAG: TetR/AcrR family transcriptional regulator, partial [Clostridiales bacterium]|nr:TetR/AcrR family transcriptional regulator [Clostridiales bacterium]
MSESRTKQHTREQIKKAFICLLAEKGLHKISVTAITEMAGINRSTFYEYYPDVRFLLEDIESSLLADLSTGFHSAYKDFKSERLDQIFAMGL